MQFTSGGWWGANTLPCALGPWVEGDEAEREREREREREGGREREREIRLRALCPPRAHTLGYVGECDQEQGGGEREVGPAPSSDPPCHGPGCPCRGAQGQRSHMQTPIIYKLSFNQNYYTFTLMLLVKIVLCS